MWYIVLSACLLWHCAAAVSIEGVEPHPISVEPLAGEKIIFTNVLFRHGDRMPILVCPNDANNKPELWSKEWQQLTNLGTEQLHSLGQFLRKRYDSILDRTYKPSEIYVRSTDVDRTIASALACLSGLYPPTGKEIWNKNLLWQPIPVHTVPYRSDYLMGTSSCQHKLNSKGGYFVEHDIKGKIEPALKHFTKMCGRPITNYREFIQIMDGFKIEERYGYTVPEWSRPFYGNATMEEVFYGLFEMTSSTKANARISAGPLIKEMLENMKAKVDGKSERVMMMYSAHDNTVSAVMNSLGVFKTSSAFPRPGYGSVLLMDLVLDKNQKPFVSLSYRNDTYSKLEKLTIPGCGPDCALTEVYSLLEDILPNDVAAECEALKF